MRRFPDTPRKRSRIEIIPMIDVMMFLLVFFVLISINVIPALGLKTKLPVSTQAADDRPPERAIVTLLKDAALQLDGNDVGSTEQLAELLTQRKLHTPNLAVIVNGDESVPLQRLVAVMDVLKSSGIGVMTIAAKRR
jgi:biopolymer transport protein ExbD